MKAIFISCNQSYTQAVVEALDTMALRGYTLWEEVQGRGSIDGEPHLGSHAWPTLNSALIVMCPNEKVERFSEMLRALDKTNPKQGLRAFILPVEQCI